MSASCRRRLHSQNVSFCTILCVLICLVSSTRAYDNEDFELFDLVEEVQGNFYELLGVESTATSSEIRKAYRKQSLLLHPDKNKEENAEEKFRQLVAVAEILKNQDMRQRYNHILEHGLPDWREPVFYYRRVRKMGLVELGILLFIILTVGHYIVLWSIYWERLLDLESIIPKKKKKSKKSNRQAAGTTIPQDNEEILAQDNPVDDPFMPVKPLLSDALPCKLYRLVLSTIISAPSTFLSVKSEIEMWRERRKRMKEEAEAELEEEEEEDEGKEKVKKRRRVDLPLYEYEPSTAEPVTYTPAETISENTNRAQQTKAGEWSQDEVTKLIRVMARFPGGTTARWEKIADEIFRPVDEVIKKAKQIKSGGYVVSVQAATQGITGAVKHSVSSKTGKTFTDDDITTSEPIAQKDNTSNKQTKRKPKVVNQSKAVDRTLLITEASTNGTSEPRKTPQELRQSQDDGEDVLVQGGVETCSWTQRQQKIFEKALSIYTKGTSERWEKVADAVPGKTKEECLLRYKELVETIRRKKQATVQPKGS
ncbi:dnaJ homolog subfamily C member 1-like [Asterias amurensis]|uniref:dnaJ homolog subfamily C member 1-like n=1 Tax=Asterias amurensis TaxID=7602 RepID=UPI003AB48DEE